MNIGTTREDPSSIGGQQLCPQLIACRAHVKAVISKQGSLRFSTLVQHGIEDIDEVVIGMKRYLVLDEPVGLSYTSHQIETRRTRFDGDEGKVDWA